jgi:hypothetical protein
VDQPLTDPLEKMAIGSAQQGPFLRGPQQIANL